MEKVKKENDSAKHAWIDDVERRLTPFSRLIIWVLLFQVIFVLYLPSLRAPFLYDDLPNIVTNPDLRYPAEPQRFFSNHETSLQFDHRPLVGFVTMLNYQLAGLDVVPYRIFNLLLHWFIAILIGEFIMQVAQHFRVEGGRLLGVLGAVVWAIHPLNTVTVIFISQRMEALMVLFYLLALIGLLRAGGGGKRKYLIAVVACCVGCLASKEVGVSLLVSLLLVDRVCHFNKWRDLVVGRWQFYGVLTLIWMGFIFWWTKGERIAELQGAVLSDPLLYFKSQCRVLVSYVQKVIWPEHLVFVAAPKITSRWLEWVPFALLLIIGFGLSGWVASCRRPWLWLPTCLFFLVLGPTSSFLPIPQEPEAEWRMYLPSACILIIVLSGLLYMAIQLKIPPKALAILTLLATSALGVATWQRAGTYRTAVSLWSDNVIKDPASTKAWINLGYSFYQEGNFQGVAQAANSLGKIGATYDDSWSKANANHMASWIAMDQGDFVEAEKLLRLAMKEFSTLGGEIDLGHALLRQGKLDEAQQHLREVLENSPENFTALILYAETLASSGELKEGELVLQRAEEINPESPKVGLVREALQDLKQRDPK